MGAAVIRCAPVGWRIRVPLRAGEMAAASDKAAILIKKGDPVQLIAGNASFTVSTTMIADEDGAQGDMIRVRAGKEMAGMAKSLERDPQVELVLRNRTRELGLEIGMGR